MLKININNYSNFLNDFSCINTFFPTVETPYGERKKQQIIRPYPNTFLPPDLYTFSFKAYNKISESNPYHFSVNDNYKKILKEIQLFESKLFR